MKKKQLRLLAIDSFQNGSLSEEAVNFVAQKLRRKDLKEYVRQLKREYNVRNVQVYIPFEPAESEIKKYEELFAGKTVQFIVDKSLLVGTTIVQNDIIIQYNLKDTLDSLKDYAGKSN